MVTNPGPADDGAGTQTIDTGPEADGGSHANGAEPHSLEAVLAAVRDSALRLLDGFPDPPTTLRIQAGDVTVEAGWGTPAPASPAIVAAPGTVTPPATVPLAAMPAADPPATPSPADTATAADDGRRYVHSPTVGTFYRAPEPGAAPFVEVGQAVRAGQQVAIVETMKLMIPVKAEESGVVVEVLKDDGDSVEHGEALFALADSDSSAGS